MPDREAIRFIKTTFTGYLNTPVKDIFGAKVLVVVAHPDDETVGAGALYRYLQNAVFAHVTDGAPRNLVDAIAHGFTSAGDYAAARAKELRAALRVAGIPEQNLYQLGVPDQEATKRLVDITLWVKDIIEKLRPETVLTLSYEGGHPDHDAVAFSTHAAAALLRKEGSQAPPTIEFPLYHAGGDGRMMRSDFIPMEDVEPITFILTEEERRLKRGMFERFETQAGMLRHFTIEEECFRSAPKYDFLTPPHEGRLYYESFEWGQDGAGWRAEASNALSVLGLSGRL